MIAEPENYVYSEAAPNLSPPDDPQHVRRCLLLLLNEACHDRVWNAPPEEFGPLYLEGVTRDCLNDVDLRSWIRNAPEKKPMYTEPDELAATDGKTRGMPYLALSEDQIDQVVAYLLTRN